MPHDPGPPTETFRRLMARWATGVSVVTGHGPSGDVGLTVNALLSVTLEPPTLLVSLSETADSTPVIEASGTFAVSFLSAGQRELSERFARTIPSAEKFRGVATHRGVTGAPILDEATGVVECRVTRSVPVGDHRLLLGEVVGLEVGPDRTPLVFFRRGYAVADGANGLVLPSPADGDASAPANPMSPQRR